MDKLNSTPKHCVLIQFDDSSCTDFIRLLQNLSMRQDLVYLGFKSDLNPMDQYLEHYLKNNFSNIAFLKDSSSNEENFFKVEPGVFYVCDRDFVERFNFTVEKSGFEAAHKKDSVGIDNHLEISSRSFKGGLIAQLLELWAYGASLVLTSISDPLVTNLVRMAWQSCSEVLPLRSPYFSNLNIIAESSFIAGNYRMYDFQELLDYVNQEHFGVLEHSSRLEDSGKNELSNDMHESLSARVKRQKVKNQNLKAITSLKDFKVFQEVIFEDMLERCRMDLGFSSLAETKKILEFYQPALHLLTKNFMKLLKEKQPPVATLLNVCDRLASDILTKVGQNNQPLRIWVLNAGVEELPFMIYDRFASNLAASLDRPYVPKGISLFATHPITHLRRPRVDLEKLREVDWKDIDISSVSRHLSEVRNQISSRKYSNNIVTAKHSPGVDPPYRQIDVLFTNGLGEVLDPTILKMFVGNLRKSLRPSAYVITSVQESKILARDLLEAGLKSRASELNILGDCHAFQLY